MRSWRAGLVAAAAMVFTLALGVILGSGPLRTALTGQSAAQADALRTQIAERDAQLAAKDEEIARGAQVLEQLVPVAVQGRLLGQGVVIVVGPGMDEDAVAATADALRAAGATVTATARLSDTWLAAEQGAFRRALAEQIVTDVGVPDAGASAEQILAGALVQALVPSAALADAPAPDPADAPLDAAISAQRSAVLAEVLTRADLVVIEDSADGPAAGDGQLHGPSASLAVILVADEADAVARAAGADRFARLGAAFASARVGTVLVTGAPQTDDVGAVVAESPAVASGASVVANGWDALGPLVVVLAAQEQLWGGSGVYGAVDRGPLLPTP